MQHGANDHREEFGFGRLFDLVADAIIVASATTGRVALWNPGAEAMFGISEDAAVGMPLVSIVPPELRGRHNAGIERYARGAPSALVDTGNGVEVPALRGDGSVFWVELKLSSVPAAAGSDERHVIAIARDITARRVADEELAARNDELNHANETLRGFLAAVAYDIVGPASGIRGAATLMAEYDDARERTELAGLIGRQADSIIELGRDLGQLAVIEAGDVPTHPTPVALRDVVSAAIEASPQVPSSDIDAHVPESLEAYADRSHAVRIVSNLMGNAVKYGAPPIVVDGRATTNFVELRIRDHGPGVPDAFVEKLFEKFSRAHTHGVGLGLGLSISRGLAQANGGDVWYEPGTQSGATFGVRLPAVAP